MPDAPSYRPPFSDVSPVFIVGSGRSGTTLLQMMLNSHPRLSIAGEIHFFDSVLQLKRWVPEIMTDADLDQFFGKLALISEFQFLPDAESLFAAVRSRFDASEIRPNRSYALFHRLLLEEIAKRRGALRFGEKTPQNLRFMHEIISLYPHAQFLHIVRDPRAVVASTKRLKWTSGDVLSHAVKWRAENFYGESWTERGTQYMRLRYEDLVKAPEASLRTICAFLDEEFEPEMLRYHEYSGDLIRDEPWKRGTERGVFTDSLKKWRRELTAAQAGLVEWVTSPLMRIYGYARSPNPGHQRLRLVLQAVVEIIRYSVHKLGDTARRLREPDPLVYGETRKLFAMLFKNQKRG